MREYFKMMNASTNLILSFLTSFVFYVIVTIAVRIVCIICFLFLFCMLIRFHLLPFRWFQNFDWDGLANLTMRPPLLQPVAGPLDTSNFDDFPMDCEVPIDETSGWDEVRDFRLCTLT